MTRRLFAVSVGWLGISMAGDGVLAVLLPFQVLESGRSDAATLGITTLVAITVAAALQPFAGRASDRIGRWPVIALGVVVAIFGLALVSIVATAIPGAVVTLAGISIAQAGHQPLVADRIARRDRGRAAGLKGFFDVGGAFLGFLLLAGLLGIGESLAAVLVLAGALALSFVAAFALLSAAMTPRTDSGSGIGPVRPRPGSDHRFLLLIAARFLFLLGIYVVGRFLLLFVADRFDLTPDAAAQQAGGLLAGLALLTALVSLPSGWLADRVGRPALMLAGGALAALGIALLPLSDSVPMIALAGGLMAIGTGAFGAGSWAALTDLTTPSDAGRRLGIANLGTAGAAAAAGAFGIVIDAGNRLTPTGGYVVTFGIAAVAAAAGGLLGWRRMTGHEGELTSRPAEAN